jgi:hypothetical protein
MSNAHHNGWHCHPEETRKLHATLHQAVDAAWSAAAAELGRELDQTDNNNNNNNKYECSQSRHHRRPPSSPSTLIPAAAAILKIGLRTSWSSLQKHIHFVLFNTASHCFALGSVGVRR